MSEIYVHRHGHKTRVPSLRPVLRRPLEMGLVMDPSLMKPEDVPTCRWMGWGIGKGVTHRFDDVSLYAAPTELIRGLHAQMVQEFGGVDPVELIYEDHHVLGFGNWVRWVYLSDPSDTETEAGVFGIDFSLLSRDTAGVANAMQDAARIAAIAHSHGIPDKAEVALIDWRMQEPEFLAAWKRSMNLMTVLDWANHGIEFFRPDSPHCPKCGQETFTQPSRFCYRCGFERHTQEVCHDERNAVDCGRDECHLQR